MLLGTAGNEDVDSRSSQDGLKTVHAELRPKDQGDVYVSERKGARSVS